MNDTRDKFWFGILLTGMTFAGITQNIAMAVVLGSILISIAIIVAARG